MTTGAIAIVIVNYNTCAELRNCLATISRDEVAEVIVVDNCSHDNSVEMVRREFPWVRVVEHKNEGYGAGANAGVALVSAPYTLILNSDVLLSPGCAAQLGERLDRNPTAGIVGPQVLNPDGTIQRSCFAFRTPLMIATYTFGVLSFVANHTRILNRWVPSYSHDRRQSVDWLLGAALAVRNEAFRTIGGFDTDVFMYSEDVDICYRVRAAGWDVVFDPSPSLVHIGGASTSQDAPRMLIQRYAALTWFYAKHYSKRRQIALVGLTSYAMLRNIVVDGAKAMLGWDRPSRFDRIRTWATILRHQWLSRAHD